MRKQPAEPSEEERKLTSYIPAGLTTQVREYMLITPLYGGGATTGQIDPLTPIRGSEIRGHLRFWWRATRGGQFGKDMGKMLEREGKIWGQVVQKETKKLENSEQERETTDPVALEKAAGLAALPDSQQAEPGTQMQGTLKECPVGLTLQIEIEQPTEKEEVYPYIVERKGAYPDGRPKYRSQPNSQSRVPPYIAFPLQPTREERASFSQQRALDTLSHADLQKRVMRKVYQCSNFTMTLTYPVDHQEEIDAALWAWETFGGIGARTRRGFGAIRLVKVDCKKLNDLPQSNQGKTVKEWLQNSLTRFVYPGSDWPDGVPHLKQDTSLIRVAYPTQNVLSTWNILIKKYASFRQFRSSGTAGRSCWPEAETVREITTSRARKRNQYGEEYDIYVKLDHPAKFPRAAFGLPIIFHFKDTEDGDPPDTTLQGAQKGNERLASPLILRPLLCGDESAIGLAVVLKGSQLPPLALAGKNLTDLPSSIESELSEDDLLKLPDLKIEKLDGNTDILPAFLEYLGGKL